MNELTDRLGESLDRLAETAHAHRDVERVMAGEPSTNASTERRGPSSRRMVQVAAGALVVTGIGALVAVVSTQDSPAVHSPTETRPTESVETDRDGSTRSTTSDHTQPGTSAPEGASTTSSSTLIETPSATVTGPTAAIVLFPPARTQLEQGSPTWAAVLAAHEVAAGEFPAEQPALRDAIAAAQLAGYTTGVTDCDVGAARPWGFDETAVDVYTVSVYFESEADARAAAASFADQGVEARVVEVTTFCLDHASNSPTGSDAATSEPPAAAYEPAGLYAGGEWVGDRTAAIVEPLADGLYYADQYTSDGNTVTLTLVQRIRGQACIDEFGGSAPEACASDGGRLNQPTAVVSATADGITTSVIFFGSADEPGFEAFRVPPNEFIRLAAGQAPSAGAPDGYEWTSFGVFVEIRGGRVISIDQQFQS